MRISSAKIENFRSIKHLDVLLDPFTCVIGHNNAGKSTFLLALRLFKSGSSIAATDFYDASNDVVISVAFNGVTDEFLEALTDEHSKRIKEIVVDGKLTLVRRYSTEGKSKLNCLRRVPRDERKNVGNVKEQLTGKKGKEIADTIVACFPEHEQKIRDAKLTSHKAAIELVETFIAELDQADLILSECDLPTGIDSSIKPLLPEILYIPAVKDLTDELKTKEASSFGKIIRVLLELVNDTEELKKVQRAFSDLDRMLNRTEAENGEVSDQRLDDVRRIENHVEEFIREQFRSVNVEIEIPPPDLKTIFGNAKIYLHDGVKTDVDSKGDGLKRAVLFSLLRTLVAIQEERDSRSQQVVAVAARYLFLFEEPELYLHPSSQRILYDALRSISKNHQVCVCTHSPYFFSAADSGAFIRLKKVDGVEPAPPFCDSLSIDLSSEVAFKDAFQIICFENSNAAFFCDRVLLVEGDCDVIYLKHIARTIKPEWDFDRRNIAVVKVGGKGSFHRYRQFFEAFDVEVRVVADLDALSDQFEKLGASADAANLRAKLISSLTTLDDAEAAANPTRSQIKDMVKKRSFRERYDRCKVLCASVADGGTLSDEEREEFNLLFADEQRLHHRQAIALNKNLQQEKEELLAKLREEKIVVLGRGAIEAYYPEGATGDDKPTLALSACSLVRSREEAVQLCDEILDTTGAQRNEFEQIFECIFS